MHRRGTGQGYGLPSDKKPQGEELLNQKGFQEAAFLFLQYFINFFPTCQFQEYLIEVL